MTQYRLTPAAQRDLTNIWDYSVETWNARQAERYVRAIQATAELLTRNKELGRRRPDLGSRYRSVTSGSHVLFYKCTDDAVEIIRILHHRMDPGRHFTDLQQ